METFLWGQKVGAQSGKAGWLAEVTAADGTRPREVQRASSERLGQEEGGQRDSSRLDSAWHMLPWGHLTLPGN